MVNTKEFVFVKPVAEDETTFGKDKLVYCAEHLAVHNTGWCSVPLNRKVMLPTLNKQEAWEQCRAMGLKLYQDNKS